ISILIFISLIGCKSGTTTTNPDPQLEMVDLINQERSAHGLPAVAHNLNLSNVAQLHSDDMVARNFLNHVNPDGDDFFARVTNAGIAYSGLGENISAGFYSMSTAHSSFMNSQAHRDNILRANINNVGVGISQGTSANDYGKSLYICVLFMQD
ncbi:MAG: CAP domain-containing protein, partial [bacterium]